jgi:hypothetical protein
MVTCDRSPGLLSASDVSLPDPGARFGPGSSAMAWVGPAGPSVPSPAAVLVADLSSELQECVDESDCGTGQLRRVGVGIPIGLNIICLELRDWDPDALWIERGGVQGRKGRFHPVAAIVSEGVRSQVYDREVRLAPTLTI